MQEYLDNEAKLAWSDIEMSEYELIRKDRGYIFQEFLKAAKDIVEFGKIEKGTNATFIEMLDFFCEKEILFFEPSDNLIYPNSRIYVKGMQRLE